MKEQKRMVRLGVDEGALGEEMKGCSQCSCPPPERGGTGAAAGPGAVCTAQRGPTGALPGIPRGPSPPGLPRTQQATGAAAALPRGGPGQGGTPPLRPFKCFGAPHLCPCCPVSHMHPWPWFLQVQEAVVLYQACVREANTRQQDLEAAKQRIVSHVRKLVLQGDEVMRRVRPLLPSQPPPRFGSNRAGLLSPTPIPKLPPGY